MTVETPDEYEMLLDESREQCDPQSLDEKKELREALLLLVFALPVSLLLFWLMNLFCSGTI